VVVLALLDPEAAILAAQQRQFRDEVVVLFGVFR
jgi:hypothetical protein